MPICKNQALPVTYEAIPNMLPTGGRDEIRYVALNATYQTSDIAWADTAARNLKNISSTQQYYFYESTGAVVKD